MKSVSPLLLTFMLVFPAEAFVPWPSPLPKPIPSRLLPSTSAVSTIRSPVSSSTSLSSNVLSTTLETIQSFSKSSLSSASASSLLNTFTQRAMSTPPIAYFLALMAAGCGVPVSEDALCIFAGAVWKTLPGERRIPMLLALYAGVVVSDFATFWIGRALRWGMFRPLADRLALLQKFDATTTKDATDTKTSKLRQRLANYGDWIGFVIRFSVGTRGPLMLLAGFSQQIAFSKFALGASLGGLFSLPLQLYAGHVLGGKNPAAVVAVVAGISSLVLTAAMVVALASWSTLLITQGKRLWRNCHNTTSSTTNPV